MRVVDTEKVPIKLWIDNIEDGALAQAKDLANLPFVFRWVAIMPDSHQGYGMPIGGVLPTTGVVGPNFVGVDIGCGMAAIKTSLTELDTDTMKAIMGAIRESVPVGFNHQKDAQPWDGFDKAPDIKIIQTELNSARKQLGTLGGGNHFIEIQKDETGRIWIMVHSGSRNLGFKTAAVYNELARALCAEWYSPLPNRDLAFLPMFSREGREYLDAMNFCLSFARANRALIMDKITATFYYFTGAMFDPIMDVHHNYAAMEKHYGHNVMVHRKGAVRARAGEVGIIPGSMGSSSYIVEGLGNPESFMSSSHGAGRCMGRKEAIRSLDLATEQKKMEGIIHGLRTDKDLDESPGSYKDIDLVMAQQEDLVKIVTKLTPLASMRG